MAATGAKQRLKRVRTLHVRAPVVFALDNLKSAVIGRRACIQSRLGRVRFYTIGSIVYGP